MELVNNNVEVVVEKKKEFELLSESANMQLAIHFRNLTSYFSPNSETRHPWDMGATFSTDDILNSFDFMICNPQYIEELFLQQFMRQILPLEFRVAQIVQYYGAASVREYINLIYNRKVG